MLLHPASVSVKPAPSSKTLETCMATLTIQGGGLGMRPGTDLIGARTIIHDSCSIQQILDSCLIRARILDLCKPVAGGAEVQRGSRDRLAVAQTAESAGEYV